MCADSSAGDTNTSTATIYLIRHGEKPPTNPPPHGVKPVGDHDPHSLTTAGWQRSGALMTLFAPLDKRFRQGFARPDRLVAPLYTDPTTPPENERTHLTIDAIRQATGYTVETPCKVGDEDIKGKNGLTLGQTLATDTGVTLLCWEHHGLQPIALGIAPHADVPPWDGKRFDMVWAFTSDTGPNGFTFDQIPQLLLPNDSANPIVGKKKEEADPQPNSA
jgi:hypothetical protein